MIRDTIPGVVGNCTTGVAFGTAWLTTNGMPTLHVISVLVGILASVATAGYYIVSWQAARKSRRRTRKNVRTVMTMRKSKRK